MDNKNFSLRPLRLDDVDRMLEWMHDDNITRYLQFNGKEKSRTDAVAFIKEAQNDGINLHRAIADSSDVYMGTVSLKNIDKENQTAEYAIALHPNAIGTGAAMQASEQILKIAAEELSLRKVYLNVLEDNKRAIHFYKKFGFTYSRTTTLKINDQRKSLRWYTIDCEYKTAPKQRRKIVFFYRKQHEVAGSLIFFLSLARHISEDPNYEVYYLNIPNKKMEQMHAGSNVICCDVDTCDYSMFEDAEFIVPINYITILLEKLNGKPCKKILLYDWHPDLARHLVAQFYYKHRFVNELLALFRTTNSLACMDKSCKLSVDAWSNHAFRECYVPVFPSTEPANILRERKPDKKRFAIGWMSRLDADKIYSLLNLLDNLEKANFDFAIDLHIIGDGNQRNKIDISKYAPKVRFIFTSYLYGEDRDKYLCENIDLMVVMGISALDVANLGIPVVIPMIHRAPFNNNQYVYLFDTTGFSLGWDKNDFNKLKCKAYGIENVITHVRQDGQAEFLGNKCAEYVRNNFNSKISCDLLLSALDNSTLTTEKCMQNRVIAKQFKLFSKYKKFRPKRTYGEFILFVQKLNRTHQEPMPKKIRTLISMCWVMFKNSVIDFKLKVAGKIQRKKKQLSHLRKYQNAQESYLKKIPEIQNIYARDGKIKVLFFVIFSSVFPTKPIFEKMLEDLCFDPYIMVTPDMQRSAQFKIETYNDTFHELSSLYGTRVLHGFDVKSGMYTDPGSEYQLVCFNNPYSKMAYKFHHVTYFLDKPVLTLYVNYGFAAIKYGRTIMKTDFYNYIWKVCLDSEINFHDLRKHEPIKGKNGLVTGYLKMDRLADAPVYSRKRKKIIICPHHTVMGWKALDISNFLRYSEFFVNLPRKYPNIDFVFRPHPLLFSNLIANRIWSKEEVENYIKRLTQVTNAIYDKSGDYFELFANSDAMIHDCSSFIGEYLFTEKPCCYMLKSMAEINEVMNPMGVQCIKNYYKAFNEKGILDFIDRVVVSEIDPLKESREKFVRKVLKFNYPHATDVVLNTVKKTLTLVEGEHDEAK